MMTSPSRAFGAVVLLLLTLPPAARTAVLKGVVVEHATNRLLARTRVSLQGRGAAAAVSLEVTTDNAGQFTFLSLPAGAYSVSAARRGFLPARFGQKAWNAPGAPIVLEDGGHFYAEIRMRRLGAVTGEILDENGVGLPDVIVGAFRPGARPRLAATGTTDDRGVYRVAGLSPGRYLIRTAPGQFPDGLSLLPTFYSQTIRTSDARIVPARADQDYPGIQIQPFQGRLGRIGGTVSGPSGTIVSEIPFVGAVTLLTDFGPRTVNVYEGGGFEFDGLAPGNYHLFAEGRAGPVPCSAFREVILSGDRVQADIKVAITPATRLQCTGTGASGPNDRAALLIRRVNHPDGPVVRVACNARPQIPVGQYEVTGAESGSSDTYLSSIGGLGNRYLWQLQLTGTGWLTADFRGPAGSVRGIVRGAVDRQIQPGTPVWLMPLRDTVWALAGGPRRTTADDEGLFSFANLPPGAYRVIASWLFDPGEFDPNSPRGVAVDLAAGSAKEIDIVVEEEN